MPSFPSNPFGRPGFDAQSALFTELTRRSCDAAGQVGKLNVQLSQQLLSELSAASRQAIASSSPLQAMAIAMSAGQAALEHISHYQQQLAAMLTDTRLQAPASSPHLQGAAAWPADSASMGDDLANAARAAGAAGYSRMH